MNLNDRHAHLLRAQEFLFKAGGRLYELPSNEVVADAILYAAAALVALGHADESEQAKDLAIGVVRGLLAEKR